MPRHRFENRISPFQNRKWTQPVQPPEGTACQLHPLRQDMTHGYGQPRLQLRDDPQIPTHVEDRILRHQRLCPGLGFDHRTPQLGLCRISHTHHGLIHPLGFFKDP